MWLIIYSKTCIYIYIYFMYFFFFEKFHIQVEILIKTIIELKYRILISLKKKT